MSRESERIYDEYLVAASMTGDKQALSRLVARWHPRLLRHAWRLLGDPELMHARRKVRAILEGEVP